MATIPFIAYEISGVKIPSYNSGAANKIYVDTISGNLQSKITEAAAGGVLSSAFQPLTASTGIHPFTATVKISSSASQTLVVDGYDTISGNAQKAQASAQIAFYESVDVDHDATTNFVANEHIDHSAVSITAGVGLAGGGTLEATRDIAVGAGTGIKVNANDIEVLGYTTISSNAANAALYQASGNEYSSAYASAQALKAHAFQAKISAQYLAVNYGWATTNDGVATIAHGLSSLPKSHWVVPSGIISFGIVTKVDTINITANITAAGSRIVQWWASV